MRGFIFSAMTLTTLLAGTAAFAAQSSGLVGSYDRLDRTFRINGHEYQLPQTSPSRPHDGDRISVEWDQQGGVRLVRSFTVDQTASDDS